MLLPPAKADNNCRRSVVRTKFEQQRDISEHDHEPENNILELE
jgi:hypothetical protein